MTADIFFIKINIVVIHEPKKLLKVCTLSRKTKQSLNLCIIKTTYQITLHMELLHALYFSFDDKALTSNAILPI